MSLRSISARVVNAIKDPETEYGKLEHSVRVAVAISRVSRRQLRKDRASMMAAALTYRTFFSLVPLLVLSLVIIKAFFGPAGIRDALGQFMLYTGLSELETAEAIAGAGADGGVGGESLTSWIEQFVDNASSYIENINYGAITIAGIALFIYAALSLFMMVEQSFNTVYRARESRDLSKRFSSYWLLLTLGFFPLMMSIGLIEWLKQAAEGLPVWLAWVSWASGLIASAGVTWGIFSLFYIAVPNTRVRLKPALIGAGIAAVLWEIAKAGLSAFVGLVMSNQAAVYGSLALVPLFMLWVYVTWMIVLFGLQAARIIQTVGTEGVLRMSEAFDEGPVFVSPACAIVLMRDLGEQFAIGEAAEPEGCADRCGIPELVVIRMLEALEDAGLSRLVASGDDDERSYVPARPVEQIRAGEVYKAVERLFQGRDALEEERKVRRLLGDETVTARPPGVPETTA